MQFHTYLLLPAQLLQHNFRSFYISGVRSPWTHNTTEQGVLEQHAAEFQVKISKMLTIDYYCVADYGENSERLKR